jgi:hypothetical protein
MSALDRGRLAKVLAMLASPHPGEVVAAAQTAQKCLRAAGITWAELLSSKNLHRRVALLEAKVNALELLNHRLRAENHALQLHGARIGGPAFTNRGVTALAILITLIFPIWVLIFLCVD